ncbi:MAG TPA: Ty1/Copia family ribonuclease HI, partial [Ktedonobacteraceae bacterium]|nr:Ty1/Copia family ribonuclease HI [Ktedonobacteraceae bacterium]
WDYVCVYVDDLLCAMKDPKALMDKLQSKPYEYKLKGVDEPKYHLGGDFFRDKDGTLCYGAQTYIKRLVDSYEKMFNEKPKPTVSPLEKGDHPELDLSDFCDEDDIAKYQSLIGALQWTISLCRFDIAAAVMTMGRFRAAPRVGHLERIKRICGYLRNFPGGAIRFRTHIPGHDEHKDKIVEHDWMYAVYGNVREELPSNMPKAKGKPVRTTTFVDANLMHDLTTGRSATGVLHLVNATPIEWFSKRQNTVESATYGSEFTAARLATDQIIDLRYTLRMFGVPLDGSAWMFGENQSVITSSNIPHSPLTKRHKALAYHRVREAIAAKMMYFLHIDGKQNPADIMTKFLPWNVARAFVEPLLLWQGDTSDIAPCKEGSDKP